MAENETETAEEITEESAEEIAEEIADAVEDAVEESNDVDTDIDVTVIEAPEPEEPEAKFASVDVGDLHISGPAEMVEKVTEQYLKDHLDHNPHGEPHTAVEEAGDVVDDTGSALVPDVVQDVVEGGAQSDIAPEPSDWLFRSRK